MNCYFEKINRNVQVFSVMGSMIKKVLCVEDIFVYKNNSSEITSVCCLKWIFIKKVKKG